MESMLSGEMTIEDAKLYEYLRDLWNSEGIFIEPSACAAFQGVFMTGSKEMQEYIDQHYTDALLNVESLCRVFNRAPSGVNKAFRDSTGHGPLTYINYRRIQEAKRIFVESKGSMTTSEVLQKVGFTNLNTFTRVFKKTEGITPGQFRNTVLQANELA